jgi:thiosulfate reductase cytochrome b subunit
MARQLKYFEHGTNAGYSMHYHRKILPVCKPCKRAHREYRMAKRKKAA